jgi:hypothetical protein
MGRPGLLSSISRGCPDGGNCIKKVFIISQLRWRKVSIASISTHVQTQKTRGADPHPQGLDSNAAIQDGPDTYPKTGLELVQKILIY